MVIQTSLGGMFTFCVSLDFTVRVYIKRFPNGHAGLFSSRTYFAQATRSDLGDRSHMQQFTTLPKVLSEEVVH